MLAGAKSVQRGLPRFYLRRYSSYSYPLRNEPPKISTTVVTPNSPINELSASNNPSSLAPPLESLPSTSLPILPTAPPFVPPLMPADEMAVPETMTTVLGNGLTVSTEEKYGQLSTFGVFIDAGSRYEVS